MATQSSAEAGLQDLQAARCALLIHHAVRLSPHPLRWNTLEIQKTVFYFWKFKNNAWFLFFFILKTASHLFFFFYVTLSKDSSIRRFLGELTEHLSSFVSWKSLPESNSQQASAASKSKSSSSSSLQSEKVLWKSSKMVFCFGSGWEIRTGRVCTCIVTHSESKQQSKGSPTALDPWPSDIKGRTGVRSDCQSHANLEIHSPKCIQPLPGTSAIPSGQLP